MSAHMVSDETINNVVSFICNEYQGNNGLRYQFKHLLGKMYNLDSDLSYDKLANDLFKLNCESIIQRYGEGEPEKFRPLDFQYRFNLNGGSNRFQALKSLRCLLYQCCEGDIPETSKLYKTMDEVSNAMAWDIVDDLEEYVRASWD